MTLNGIGRLSHSHGFGTHINLEMKSALVADCTRRNRIPITHTSCDIVSGLIGSHIIVSVWAGWIGHRLLEPVIILPRMIEYEIEIDADILGFRLVDQVFQVGLRTQLRTN